MYVYKTLKKKKKLPRRVRYTAGRNTLRFLMYYTWANPVEYCQDPSPRPFSSGPHISLCGIKRRKKMVFITTTIFVGAERKSAVGAGRGVFFAVFFSFFFFCFPLFFIIIYLGSPAHRAISSRPRDCIYFIKGRATRKYIIILLLRRMGGSSLENLPAFIYIKIENPRYTV